MTGNRPDRKYQMSVDSGAPHEPMTRYFTTADAAWRAADELGEEWIPYVDVRVRTVRDGRERWPRVDREGTVAL